jgi:hypothetical protein
MDMDPFVQAPTDPPRQRRHRRLVWIAVVGVVLAGVVACLLYGVVQDSYLNYERTHDIPNPQWGIYTRSYTYTPATADKLSPLLLKTRPDQIVLQDIHDYIQLAGTYPCVTDLADYSYFVDPILSRESRSCSVQRPVTDVTVTKVYVGILGPGGAPGANVSYVVTYADGTQWTNEDVLNAVQYQQYFASYIHLTCWDSEVITVLYSYILPVSQVPNGVEYSVQTPTTTEYLCKA